MIRTIAPPNDINNNGKQTQDETEQSVDKEDEESAMHVNGHVSNEDQELEGDKTQPSTSKEKVPESLYKIGEMIDAKDPKMGAWFEAKIVDISVAEENNSSSILYHVVFDGSEEDEVNELPENSIRPIARTAIPWEQISVGQLVMANYNHDEPDERGYWYDFKITKKLDGLTRKSRELYARLLLGNSTEDTVAEECRLKFIDKEIFQIEGPPDPCRSGESISSSSSKSSPAKRQVKPDCSYCKDDPKKLCKHCNCHKCGGKENPGDQLLCDECDLAYHIYCLSPPLEKIPEDDEWYCPLCKNDTSQVIHAGEKLRESKKKMKMASSNSTTNRDWGKGMACVGRTKVCSIVPPNHFGPIPGVPVGSCWKFRVQVSEAGIHRPHVSGIHGRDGDGAYSIVLAGGYEGQPSALSVAMASKASLMLAALLASSLIGSLAEPVGSLRGADRAVDSGVDVPDVSGLPDTPGPYQEEPNNTDADKPKAAIVDWRAQVPNATQGSLGSLLSLSAWQEHQFCNLHKTGFFCENSTRIRCCKLEGGYAKCGSTANSSACSEKLPEEPKSLKSKMLKTGAGWWPGVWHIHPGWHVSSFCQSHHVGSFCRSHHVIHCCNDYGHFVECNTRYHDSGYFC